MHSALRRPGGRSSALAAAVGCLLIGVLASEATAVDGGPSPPSSPPPPQRPNIVVVMTDDQPVEQMGALRRVRDLTRRAGTTFTNSFASFPLCCPSRATYLTGQYEHNHGVLAFSSLRSANTLPVWLGQSGYTTAHVGKYLNGYGTRDPREVPAGWHEWFSTVDPTTYNYLNYCVNDNGRLVAYGVVSSCPGGTRRARAYQTDLYTRRAVSYINRRAPSAQPFFLSVAYLAPHAGGPHVRGKRCNGSAKSAARHRGAFADAALPRPPGFNEADVSDKPAFVRTLPRLSRSRKWKVREGYQCRRESLLAVDEGVGAMVQALVSAGELDNTLLIFTSDNGFFQGEHRVTRGKQKVYEPSVRVPLLMRGPGVPPDRRVAELAGNIDLAPTILDAAEVEPRTIKFDGVSLLDLARNPRLSSRRAILLEGVGAPGHSFEAIRTDRHKYVEYPSGEHELYDLASDPFEQTSLHRSPAHEGVRKQLAEQLSVLRECSGPTCRRDEDDPSSTSGGPG